VGLRTPFLRRDNGAAIEVPFKVLISLVVMTMAIVVLLPALQAYQSSEVERRTEVAAAGIASAARSVYLHPGSSRSYVLDVPPAGSVHLVSMSIGGNLDVTPGESCVISWRLSDGTRGSHAITTNGGQVPLAGVDGHAVTIEGPRAILALEAREAPPRAWCDRYVEVRVL
jgi:hypothetical protein